QVAIRHYVGIAGDVTAAVPYPTSSSGTVDCVKYQRLRSGGSGRVVVPDEVEDAPRIEGHERLVGLIAELDASVLESGALTIWPKCSVRRIADLKEAIEVEAAAGGAEGGSTSGASRDDDRG